MLVVAACTGEDPDDEVSVTPVTLPTVTAEPDAFPGKSWQRNEQGSWSKLDATLERTGSTCVAVIKDGELVHDAYWNGGSEHGPHRVYSITKSLTALLIGMAADEGLTDARRHRVGGDRRMAHRVSHRGLRSRPALDDVGAALGRSSRQPDDP